MAARSLRFDRKAPKPHAGLLDDHHAGFPKTWPKLLQTLCQSFSDMSRTRTAQSKQDYSDGLAAGRSDDFAEIEIERQQDTRLSRCLIEDVPIR